MKQLACILALVSQTGCAVYTVASTTSLITTDKSLADHALTATIPYSDCGTFNLFKGLYYCEIQDPSQTYNRSAF